MRSAVFDVAVIGAGASGVLVAAHFHRAADEGKRLALIDAGARAARGLAYGTPYGAHLLNVPAGRMSAFADDPEHFLRWLRERAPGSDAQTFAPRNVYGDYLHDVLDGTAAVRIGGSAVGLLRDGEQWVVHLHDGATLAARAVVLALGNLPPADPLHLGETAPAGYLRDPWAPGATIGLAHDAPVLLIGTGLTMVDVALALRHDGHRGPIHALSRRGRLPAPHVFAAAGATETPPEGSPRALLRWVRSQSDWRAAIDSLRPRTAQLWQSWTTPQRRSFLRHLRTIWDVHRHRMAPDVAREIEAMRASGELQVHRGRVVSLRADGPDVVVELRGQRLRVARAINCTGPATDYERLDLPLVSQLRRAGWLVPDALRLGVETDDDGRLLDRDGSAVRGLYTLGPLLLPRLWETTAIPEIRAQSEALVKLLLR